MPSTFFRDTYMYNVTMLTHRLTFTSYLGDTVYLPRNATIRKLIAQLYVYVCTYVHI